MVTRKAELFVQDLFEYLGEVLVIPHSTAGTINDLFRDRLNRNGIIPRVPEDSQLGDVVFVQEPYQSELPHLKYIAYACTVQNQQSSYSCIWKVAKNLARNIPTNIHSLGTPLLGTGAGGLELTYSYYILSKTFYEELSHKESIQLVLCVLGDEQAERIQENEAEFRFKNGKQIAFDASIRKISSIGYFEKIREASEFYYSFGRNKYFEFKKWESSNPRTLEHLLVKIKSGYNGFANFLNSYEKGSDEFHILNLVGQLIAYIDSNAANKSQLNEYSDNRTLAKSNVRQNVWVENLLRFKVNGCNLQLSNLPPNILHALEYFENPGDRLMMLSDNHREALCTSIFEITYEPKDFHHIVLNYFMEQGISAKAAINNGALATRILYAPEVKELWEIGHGTEDDNFSDDLGDEFEGSTPRQISHKIKAVFHSDSYATVDSLDYELYAKAIKEFIVLKDTKAPLTIGIMAPWGKGKTTLMRFIEKKINQNSQIQKPEPAEKLKQDAVQSTISNIQSWLGGDNIFKYIRDKISKFSKLKFKSFSSKKTQEGINEGLKKMKEYFVDFNPKLSFPTIWFNAWKFQKNQQVWAAFGHEIIHQLVAALKNKIREEEFWFKINLARIDRDKVRDTLYGAAILKIASWSISVSAIAFLIFLAAGSTNYLIPSILGTATGISAWQFIKNNTPDLRTANFLVQPDYKKDMGFLYMLEQDLKNVFKLLVNRDKPAVIFIDDLDRCSPAVTTEIIESINSFISSEELQCFFILGQDVQMIAASLNVTYEKVAGKIEGDRRRRDSLGWSFMEKFIQVQFSIPNLNEIQKIKMLGSLFRSTDIAVKSDITRKTQELYNKIETAADTSVFSTEEFIAEKLQLEQLAPEQLAGISERIIERTAKELEKDSGEIASLIENLAPYIGDSPRTIKRIVNMYRFYRFLQAAGVNNDFSSVDNTMLGYWIILGIRWPEVVRCLQWTDDTKLFKAYSAKDKASEFYDLITSPADFDGWVIKLTESKCEFAWLHDKELFDFFRKTHQKGDLEKAFDAGLF